MEGFTPAHDTSEPGILHCNSKGLNPSSIDASPATVTLYVYGLGVWYLLSNAPRGIMKFLREESHKLSIRIIEKNSEGEVSADDTVVIPMTTDAISITSNRPSRSQIELNESGTFDRHDWQSNDPEDLRWLVNMTNDIHGGVPVAPIPHEKVLTPMRVTNALFYTKNFTDYDMNVVLPTGELVNDRFGAVGCVIGAKIEAESVTISQQNVIDRTLTKVPNFTHEVYIYNQGNDIVSDFYKYYWILGEQSSAPRQFNLEAVGMSSLSGQIVCNSIGGDGDGEDDGDH